MRNLQTVAALNILKSLLMVFNVLFWVSGIVLLILGVWLHVELHKFVDLSSGSESGGGTASQVPYVLIGLGMLILIIGTASCCAAINEQPVLLYVYGCFLSIVCVIEISVCLTGYPRRTQLSEAFERGLNASMSVYNVDYSRTSSINSLQAHMHCCGIRDYKDWFQVPYGKVPGSCCKTNMGCDTKDLRVIYKQGCYTLVTQLISSNFQQVTYLGLGIGLFQAVGIVLTVLLAKLLRKTKYEQMS